MMESRMNESADFQNVGKADEKFSKHWKKIGSKQSNFSNVRKI